MNITGNSDIYVGLAMSSNKQDSPTTNQSLQTKSNTSKHLQQKTICKPINLK